MKKRQMFAVVTARASASEQSQLLEGITFQAMKINTDVAVISNIYNASEYNDFITLENNIYSLVNSDKPDGFIYTDDSFMNPVLRERILKMLSESGIPVVCAGYGVPDFPSADICTMDDIEHITDHLIEVHGFDDIDILTGPEGLATAEERTEGYRKSLRKHGIKISEEKIIYGDFWTISGENTALEYINGERKKPQAVVCANDYMAYGMCDTFLTHGIKVPDDITVMGYEYIGDRTNHYPVLSTYLRNRKSLGSRLVIMLDQLINGGKTDFSEIPAGKIISGDSCPCGADYRILTEEIQLRHRQIYYDMLNDTGMLEQYLTESKDISDLISALNRHSYFIPDLSGLYLCLYEDWCVSADTRNKERRGNEDMICYTISDIYTNGAEPVHFSHNEIIPESIRNTDIPNVCYCCPVFFMEEDYGYMIVRYDHPECIGESFKNWLKIVSNALEFLRMKNDISYLIQCRNLSDYHDSVTGLNNRDGFINEMKIIMRNADSSDRFFVFLIKISIDHVLSDTEKINLIAADTGEILRTLSDSAGRICGRLNTDTYVFALSGRFDDLYITYLTDRIKTLMYGCFCKYNLYGDDCCVYESYLGMAGERECSEITAELETASERKMSAQKQRIKKKDYTGYCNLRTGIYMNPSASVSADEACRLFCLSSGHFRVRYKEYFGVSYHQDCIVLKVQMAKYLILTTKMNIAAVSERCGYENEKYFMHQFRQITGMTPNQYRGLNI